MAALVPGLLLSVLYVVFITVISRLRPGIAPAATGRLSQSEWRVLSRQLAEGFLPPALLIALVLGLILGGWATLTEASNVGALGGLLLVLLRGRMSVKCLNEVLEGSLTTVLMISFIFVGATAFSYLFRRFGGDHLVLS